MKGLPHTDQRKGLYRKYEVKRTDGSSEEGRKHAGCAYFVLDLIHDKFAGPALLAYANACETEYPALAKELRKLRPGEKCTTCDGDGREPDPRCGCREAACPHVLMFPGPCPKCRGWGVARGHASPSVNKSSGESS